MKNVTTRKISVEEAEVDEKKLMLDGLKQWHGGISLIELI